MSAMPCLNSSGIQESSDSTTNLVTCARSVGADGVMLESEAELLRAVADTLDCPIPPFVQTE